jgi:hypothetical protein
MNRVRSFLEQHSRIDTFTPLMAMMSPHPDFIRFNKLYSQVAEWSRKEINAVEIGIVSVIS